MMGLGFQLQDEEEVRDWKGRLARDLEPPELRVGRPGTSSSLVDIGMVQGCSLRNEPAVLDRERCMARDFAPVAQKVQAEANQVR
jgi:hypothetical protein